MPLNDAPPENTGRSGQFRRLGRRRAGDRRAGGRASHGAALLPLLSGGLLVASFQCSADPGRRPASRREVTSTPAASKKPSSRAASATVSDLVCLPARTARYHRPRRCASSALSWSAAPSPRRPAAVQAEAGGPRPSPGTARGQQGTRTGLAKSRAAMWPATQLGWPRAGCSFRARPDVPSGVGCSWQGRRARPRGGGSGGRADAVSGPAWAATRSARVGPICRWPMPRPARLRRWMTWRQLLLPARDG